MGDDASCRNNEEVEVDEGKEVKDVEECASSVLTEVAACLALFRLSSLSAPSTTVPGTPRLGDEVEADEGEEVKDVEECTTSVLTEVAACLALFRLSSLPAPLLSLSTTVLKPGAPCLDEEVEADEGEEGALVFPFPCPSVATEGDESYDGADACESSDETKVQADTTTEASVVELVQVEMCK